MVKICKKIEEEIPRGNFDFYSCRISNEELLKKIEKEKTFFELIGRSVFLEIREGMSFKKDDLITLSLKEEDPNRKIIKINRDVIEDFEENQYILLGKGEVTGVIEEIRENSVTFRVIREGSLERYPDLRIFGKIFSLELLDERDRKFMEEYSPFYCVIGGIKEKSEIRKVRKEYGGTIFIPKVDTREFVQNFDDFIKEECFLYFSRDELLKNFPLSFVQKMEMTLIKRANENGVGSIVEINVENPLYKYDLYNYLMNRVDVINLIGRRIPKEFYNHLKKNLEFFEFKIPREYLSIINFLEEISEVDKLFLDVEDIKILAYFSKRRTWKKVISLKNELVNERVARLFSNVEISSDIEEGYPVVYEREDVISVRVPKETSKLF